MREKIEREAAMPPRSRGGMLPREPIVGIDPQSASPDAAIVAPEWEPAGLESLACDLVNCLIRCVIRL